MKTLDEHNETKRQKAGVKCPKCSTEMIYIFARETQAFLINPPRSSWVKCPNTLCNYKGTKHE